MCHRWLASVGALAVAVSVVSQSPALVGAQTKSTKASNAPLTPDGHVDLEGVWDFSTITPLERPSDFGDKAVLSDEEAAVFERDENRRQNRDLIDPKKGGGQYLPGSVVPYNEFWYERGDKIVGSKRTSLIVDPPDGRIPPLTPAAQQKARCAGGGGPRRAARPRSCRLGGGRSLADRCILGFNAGPPMTPGAYNNHVQIFQTAGIPGAGHRDGA